MPTFQTGRLRLVFQGRDRHTVHLSDLPKISVRLLREAQTQTQGVLTSNPILFIPHPFWDLSGGLPQLD